LITISPTNNTQSFGTVAARVNQIAAIISSNTLTTDSSSNGSLTTGNAYVNGFVGVISLYSNTIGGGNLAISSNLSVSTNTIFWNGISPLLSILSNSTTSNINFNSNNILIKDNTNINGILNFSNVITLGSNLNVNNSITSNTLTSNLITTGINIINTTVIAVGSNVYANSSSLKIGNATVSFLVNSTALNLDGSIIATIGSNLIVTTSSLSIGSNVIVNNSTLTITDGINSLVENSSIILIGNSTVNAIVNSTVYTGISNNATNFAGQSQAFYANVTSPLFSTSVTVGSNVIIDTTKITFGNSTVNTIVNSSIYTGTSLLANNSTYFNGLLPTYFANSTSPSISISVNIGSNVSLGTSSLVIGNSIVNSVLNSTSLSISSLSTPLLTLGNSSVNATVNSSIFTGLSYSSNNTLYFNGQLPAYYANVTTPIITTSISIGGNVVIDLSKVTFGNSTVNSTVNSSVYTGISNNTTYFNGQLPAYFANISSPIFATTASVGTNVSINTSNMKFNGVTSNTNLNSSNIILTDIGANSSTLTSTLLKINSSTSDFISISSNGLVYNNLTTNPTKSAFFGYNLNLSNTTFINATANSWANVIINPEGLILNSSLGNSTVNASFSASLNTTSFTFGNSTVNVSVNTTTYSGTSNNATNFAGHPVGYYANVTSPSFNTNITVGSNVTLDTIKLSIGNSTVNSSVNSTIYSGTSNNSINLNGNPSTYYANITSPIFTTTTSVGANVVVNTSVIFIGNSTVNCFINSTSLNISNLNANIDGGSF
jgi:hypothetical protein